MTANKVSFFCYNVVFLLFLAWPVSVTASDPAAFSIVSDTMIVDQAGRKIKITRPFSKIISLYGAHTENLFFLGLDEQIIGVGKNEAFPPEARNKPVFSYHDDPEKFMAAMPDLVLVRPMIDKGYPKLMKRLEKSGIIVVSLQPATVSKMYDYWKMLGLLTGKIKPASRMIHRFKKAVSDFKALGKQPAIKQRVYFEAIHKRMKTFSPTSMAIFALESAGGINVAKDAVSVRQTNIAAYGKEKILSRADHIDVFLAQTGAMNSVTKKIIETEPGFKVIKAVQNNRVFLVDEMIVSRPTIRLLEGVYTIGRILYPELFETKGKDIFVASQFKTN